MPTSLTCNANSRIQNLYISPFWFCAFVATMTQDIVGGQSFSLHDQARFTYHICILVPGFALHALRSYQRTYCSLPQSLLQQRVCSLLTSCLSLLRGVARLGVVCSGTYTYLPLYHAECTHGLIIELIKD